MINKYLINRNRIIRVKITRDSAIIINYCLSNNIYLKNTKISPHYLECDILFSDLKKLRRAKMFKIKIIRRVGLYRYINLFFSNKQLMLMIGLSYLVLLVLSNFCFKVKIYHDNQEMINLVSQKLDDFNISEFSLKKSFDEIERIEKEIIKELKEKVEWIEITPLGNYYIVNVQEKKTNNLVFDDTPQHIISRKKGIVKKIYATSGEVLIHNNEYININQVLINGVINHNEKTNFVKADGFVYAHTFSKVNVSYPISNFRKKLTTKQHKGIGIILFNKLLYRETYEFSDKTINKSFSSIFLPFEVVTLTEEEYLLEEEIISPTDIIIHANQKADTFVLQRLSEDEHIYSKNVLKIKMNNSRIELEILYVLYENIGISQKIKIE